MRNGDQRTSTAFLERSKKECLYRIEKWQNKHWNQLWGSSKFVPSPCPSDKEHGPGSFGREASMWKATYRGCCQQHSEMKTSICQEYMFLLWLIWFQIVRLLVAWNYSCKLLILNDTTFFSLPCCIAVNPVCQKSRHSVHFFDGDLVLQMFSFVHWPYLCVFCFSWLVQNQDWFAVFLVFCCFSTLHFFFGGFPSPNVSFPDPHSSCMLPGQPAMWFEVRFVVSGALPAAKS